MDGFDPDKARFGRRAFLRRSAALLGGGVLLAQARPGYARIVHAGPPAPPPPATPLERRELVAGLYIRDAVSDLALTFDDVPRARFGRMVIDWLARHDQRATFFIQGNFARVLPDMIKELVDRGHELGNHTFDHPNLARLNRRQIARQLDRTQDAVDKALGYHYPLRFVRPPYGSPWIGGFDHNARRRVADVVAERGGALVFWQRSSGDTSKDCDPNLVVAGFERTLRRKRGGVWVFHPTTCAKGALGAITQEIAKRGLRPRLVSELLEAKYGVPVARLSELPTLLRRGRTAAASVGAEVAQSREP